MLKEERRERQKSKSPQKNKQKTDRKYFEQGLDYLKNGAKITFSKMKGCDLRSLKGQKKIFCHAQNLKANLDYFCETHLESSLGRSSRTYPCLEIDVIDKSGCDDHNKHPNKTDGHLDQKLVKDLFSELRSIKKRLKDLSGHGGNLQKVIESQITDLKDHLSEALKRDSNPPSDDGSGNKITTDITAKIETSENDIAIVQGNGGLGLTQIITEKHEEILAHLNVQINMIKDGNNDDRVIEEISRLKDEIRSIAEILDKSVKEGCQEAVEEVMEGLNTSLGTKIELLGDEHIEILKLITELPEKIADAGGSGGTPTDGVDLSEDSKEYLQGIINNLNSSLQETLDTVNNDQNSLQRKMDQISKNQSEILKNLSEIPTRIEANLNPGSKNYIKKRIDSLKVDLEKKIDSMSFKYSQSLEMLPEKISQKIGPKIASGDQKLQDSLNKTLNHLMTEFKEELSTLKPDPFDRSHRIDSERNFSQLIDNLKSSLEGKIESANHDYTEKFNQLPDMISHRVQHMLSDTKIVIDLKKMTEEFQGSLKNELASFKVDLNANRQQEIDNFKVSMEDIFIALRDIIESWNLKTLGSIMGRSAEISQKMDILVEKFTKIFTEKYENALRLIQKKYPKKSDESQGGGGSTQQSGSDIMEDLIGDNAQSIIDRLELTEEIVRNYGEEGVIGGDQTFLAIKDENSFLIGTKGKGLKLYENGSTKWTGILPLRQGMLNDMIYIEPLDCYILQYNLMLYRKDINDQPAYLYMQVRTGFPDQARLRFSNKNQKLVVSIDMFQMSAINLESKQVEIAVDKTAGEGIIDFRIFGEDDHRVISISKDGYINLYELDFKRKQGKVVNSVNFDLSDNLAKQGECIAVCDKGRYGIVELALRNQNNSYGVLLYEILAERVVKKAFIDRSSAQIGNINAIECLGYLGRHILWFGISSGIGGVAMVYDYDTLSQEFKEIEEKRTIHREHMPVKLHRLGNHFYYIGWNGQLRRFGVKLEE